MNEEKKNGVYSLHGLLKQKFIRFMHSRGQCYTNELHFPFQPISVFDLRLYFFHRSLLHIENGFFFLCLSMFKAEVVIPIFPHSTLANRLQLTRPVNWRIVLIFFFVIKCFTSCMNILRRCLMNDILLHQTKVENKWFDLKKKRSVLLNKIIADNPSNFAAVWRRQRDICTSYCWKLVQSFREHVFAI